MGKIGTVNKIEDDTIHVLFHVNEMEIICPLKKFSFTTYVPVTKTVIAKREQFPIKPAYALTIHKSQGMSLKYVVIECQHWNIPGQLDVAAGRATATEGLQVLNFKPSYVCLHPQSVYSFYKTCNIGNVHPQ